MAKTMTQTIQRKARRVMPTLKGKTVRATVAAKKITLTLGDLIAAAFDTVGSEVKDVARVLRSNELAAAIGKRIVTV